MSRAQSPHCPFTQLSFHDSDSLEGMNKQCLSLTSGTEKKKEEGAGSFIIYLIYTCPGILLGLIADSLHLSPFQPRSIHHLVCNSFQDNIADVVIKSIQPYIDSDEFQPAAIAKVSKACTSICQWVRAMHKYHFVAKAVEPKRVSTTVMLLQSYQAYA